VHRQGGVKFKGKKKPFIFASCNTVWLRWKWKPSALSKVAKSQSGSY